MKTRPKKYDRCQTGQDEVLSMSQVCCCISSGHTSEQEIEMGENEIHLDMIESLTMQDCVKDSCTYLYTSVRDRRSQIRFKLIKGKNLESDVFLNSIYGSHFLEGVEENSVLSQMHLRDGDKFLGINYQPLECYDHESVMEMLHYLFHPPINGPVNLMVERYQENGPKIVEIEVSSTDDGWASFQVGTKDIPITVQVYISSAFTLNIYQIRALDRSQVLIQPAGENAYVIPKDRELFIEPGKDEDDYVFTYYEYDGKCRRRGHVSDKMFFAVFKSFRSQLYITACSETELLLTSGNEPPKYNDRKIKEDPRTFIIHKTDQGYSMFESLTFRGCYWVSRDNSKRLVMRKLSRCQLNENPDAWFTLFPYQNMQ